MDQLVRQIKVAEATVPPATEEPRELADDYLLGFDVDDAERHHLAEIAAKGLGPADDVRLFLRTSLEQGAEQWEQSICCARAMKERATFENPLDGQDVLTFLAKVYRTATPSDDDEDQPRRATAARADLVVPLFLPETSRSSCRKRNASQLSSKEESEDAKRRSKHSKRHRKKETRSPFWHQLNEEQPPTQQQVSLQEVAFDTRKTKKSKSKKQRKSKDPRSPVAENAGRDTQVSDEKSLAFNPIPKTPRRTVKSSYFDTPQTSSPLKAKNPRPPRGTVSSIPFPRLDAEKFGLVQEELAGDPFRLLIAVTFLIRTTGKSAMPVFWRLMDRWPTPEALVIADRDEIVAMIKHLGFGAVRAAKIQKYARLWIEEPPRAGVRYGVKHYPDPGDGADVHVGEALSGPDDEGDPRTSSAWEIGHMTQGRYAIDSWRIFCRDALRGRARDWRGAGREGEFQPEWMRVLPRDKELRACLRWLWMREGWQWHPETGERDLLPDDLRRAVQAGRVAYDDTGGLRILDEGDAAVAAA
ncbi:hypothetical protein GGR56DRAFT_680789 [Xylariaceae sp. FL0804]|nr:hypothetical protein GGR56DRAFT_680789 [Xylariaceae sp. FL0804]